MALKYLHRRWAKQHLTVCRIFPKTYHWACQFSRPELLSTGQNLKFTTKLLWGGVVSRTDTSNFGPRRPLDCLSFLSESPVVLFPLFPSSFVSLGKEIVPLRVLVGKKCVISKREHSATFIRSWWLSQCPREVRLCD